jgi:hypothetical protein
VRFERVYFGEGFICMIGMYMWMQWAVWQAGLAGWMGEW